jgi:D-alanyl-D-alanine carboxypeptidase (penicillin-binding protein 5/6)
MTRRTFAIMLVVLAICIGVITPVLAYTPVGQHLLGSVTSAAPVDSAAPLIAYTPTPTPRPRPVLMVVGTPPTINTKAAYLLDGNSGNTLDDYNGETPLPMASTTKIMTAVLAIQDGNPNLMVTVHQDALNEVINNHGSSAQLVLGDQIPLKDLLYGLLLPSGDDAAIAIADAISGSASNFTTAMNVEAYRLHLFQTHYINPDGLTYYQNNGQTANYNYTSAYDLARLASYAMQLPQFAQIVKTQHYVLAATSTHHAYHWDNTNDLLGPTPDDPNGLYTYPGITGIKTGFTLEAGYCLVFSAIKNGQSLIGVVLYSTNTSYYQRFRNATTLLNWGFRLPLKVPTG